MSPKKVNASAMRRERQEILQERSAPREPLPAEFLHWLQRDYVPTDADLQTHWRRLRPFVLAVLERSKIRGVESLRKHTTHVAYLGGWLLRAGIELAPESVTRARVAEYTRTGMPGSSKGSRGDRRSRLFSIADQVNPEQAPVKPQPVHRDPLKPPYTADEMTAICRAILVQPTAEITRQLCVCVGCGAGAGIDSPDLKLLTAGHFVDQGADGILINVPGKHARQVWVLREYESYVRRGMAGVPASTPVLGRNQDRKNVASRVFENATLLGSLPKLEQSRLRTTWIATLMSRPVPMKLLCDAAGLRSTRTLFDLLPYLTDSNAASTTGSTR
jgi:hypothetical protein